MVLDTRSWQLRSFDALADWASVSRDGSLVYLINPATADRPVGDGLWNDPLHGLGAEVRVLDSASGKDVALLLQNRYPLQLALRGRDRVYVVTPGDDYRTQGSFGAGEFQTQVTSYEVGTWRELARRSGYLPQRISAS